MFKKILIANRGEIACRVIKTARRMGIATVAVYSDADADALHVAMADEALCVGPAPANESYLVADRILEIAQATGAEAIHPGYGFLSENAGFTEACEASGVKFIGPSASAILAMGLKGAAKEAMEGADVPVVPGYHGASQDLETLAKEAERIGFPVLIKAVAGGGGKGMRQVDRAEDFAEACKAAQREGESAFGNAEVLIEKFLTKPRHIEIQVFADGHGNAVHLFERDCSLQRRHQKVIEEAPAPGMSDEMRTAMGDAAVRAALAIQYEGAGTIEFIVDVANGLDNAPFYFMEMNTRLQVEHPVTEMITGTDLVEWQLRVASGEVLPRTQDALTINGHAFEARLYAEDPARDFLPQTGTLARFRTPNESSDLRVETGVREGDAVSVYYDPMIAKIVVHGPDRETALARLSGALDHTHVAGFPTNMNFLRNIACNAAFANAELDTGFIPRHASDLLPAAKPASELELALVTIATAELRKKVAAKAAAKSADPYSPWHAVNGWRLNATGVTHLEFRDETGESHSLQAEFSGSGYSVQLGGGSIPASGTLSSDGALSATVGDRKVKAVLQVDGEVYTLLYAGGGTVLTRVTHRADDDAEAEGQNAVIAPMPGKVLDVRIADGDAVTEGQALLVLEAMKMEHTLTAPRDGTVANLTLTAGEQVSEGSILLTVEDDNEN